MNEEFGARDFAVDVLCDENGFVALPFRCMEDEGIVVNWGDGEPEPLKGTPLFLAEHRYDTPKTWHRIIASCEDWSKVWMMAYKSERGIFNGIAPQNPVFKARSCTWRFLTPIPAIAGVIVNDWTNPSRDVDGQFIFRDCETKEVNESLEYAMCFFGKIEELPSDVFSNVNSVSFEGTFKACTIKCSLQSIFNGQGKVKSFASCFEEVDFVSQSTSYPIAEGQFFDSSLAEDFSKLFKDSNLSYVPEGLFYGCQGALTFRSCFYGTRINHLPRQRLFEYCTKAEDFTACFSHCRNLEIVNDGLFYGTSGKNFSWCFSKCTSLDAVRTPFEGCMKAETFYGCFNECTSLISVNGNVFMDCSNAKDFGSCFNQCESLCSIPDGIFSNAISAEDFDSVFRGCRSVTCIPRGLFSKCRKAVHFGGAFNDCISLEQVKEDVFRGCSMAESFEACFLGCVELESVPVNLFSWCKMAVSFKRCFDGCFNLVDFMRLAILSPYVSDARDFLPKNASFSRDMGTIIAVPAGTRTERSFRDEERENKSMKVSSIHYED